MRRQDPDELTLLVGRRIAELRRAKMTQAEFAEAMRTSVQWVSHIENGANLTLHTLAKIANVLGVRVAELFEAPRSPRPPGPGRPPKPRA